MPTIQGILRLTTPLHISSPSTGWKYDPKSNKVVNSLAVLPPCTRTQTMPVNLTSEESEGRDVSQIHIPIMQPNGIRGRLRRRSADIIQKALAEKSELISKDAYHILRTGASSGRPKTKVNLDLDTYMNVRDSLHMGIWGGSPKMIASRITTNIAWPITADTLALGLVPSEYEKYATQGQLRSVVMTTRNDDLLQNTDITASEVIKDYENAVAEWTQMTAKPDKKGEGKDDKKKKKGAKEEEEFRGLRSWTAHEVVNPGICFFFSLQLDFEDQAKIGLIIRSLQDYLSRPFGGHVANHGYGQFSVMDGMFIKSEDGTKTNLFTPNSDTLIVDTANSELLDDYMTALDEALEEITAEEIENVTLSEC